MARAKVIFKNGKVLDSQPEEISNLISELKSRSGYLHALPIADILDFFDALSARFKNSPELKKNGYSKNIVDFLSRSELETSLKIALRGNVEALDKFTDLGDKKFLFHAQPRGLAAEWLAGNVPILGLFSIFMALITKNVCLAKASAKGYRELLGLLELLGDTNTEKIKGADMLNCLTVVLIDNENRESHEELSLGADVRLAWGGAEAIKNITGLKKNPFTEDVIFGPKYSYAVIDKESLAADKSGLAQRLALDVSVFDQYACSSPHTVLVEEGGSCSASEFAEEVARQLELVNRTLLPKGIIEPAKAAEILNLRSEYAITGKVWKSSGTEWTVLYSEDAGLFPGCFSRVIMVKPVKNLGELANYSDRGKQTLGIALTLENKMKYLDNITLKGIDRCPVLGNLTFFESPWDGMFVFDRLIRWVSATKN